MVVFLKFSMHLIEKHLFFFVGCKPFAIVVFFKPFKEFKGFFHGVYFKQNYNIVPVKVVLIAIGV
jgi:hypothetical protein